MLALLAIAAITPSPQPSRAKATASVRIHRSARVTSSDWEDAAPHRKREITIRDEKGEKLVIRVIEFE